MKPMLLTAVLVSLAGFVALDAAEQPAKPMAKMEMTKGTQGKTAAPVAQETSAPAPTAQSKPNAVQPQGPAVEPKPVPTEAAANSGKPERTGSADAKTEKSAPNLDSARSSMGQQAPATPESKTVKVGETSAPTPAKMDTSKAAHKSSNSPAPKSANAPPDTAAKAAKPALTTTKKPTATTAIPATQALIAPAKSDSAIKASEPKPTPTNTQHIPSKK